MGDLSDQDAAQTFQAPAGPSTEGAPEDARHTREHHARLQRMAAFEGINYDPKDSLLDQAIGRGQTHHDYQSRFLFQWVIPCLIGVSMGVIALFVDWGIELLVSLKYETTRRAIRGGGGFVAPYLIYLTFTVAYAAAAGGLVSFVEPLAAGSGIPELKTYLNGVHLPNLLKMKTLVAKLVGIMFSIGAGLIAGKEGPFVHGGGVVGSGIGQMGCRALGLNLPRRWGGIFRNDIDHRDFTSIGTAAGVATAFAAPIGGALFTIEEGCSFYSTYVFWRCFLATCSGVLTLHWLVKFRKQEEGASLMFARLGADRDFGLYDDATANYGAQYWYYVWEIPIFVLMGMLGGLMGAAFIQLNVQITGWRLRRVPVTRPTKRALEVVAMAAVTGTVMFSASYFSPCVPLPSHISVLEHISSSEALLGGDAEVGEHQSRFFPQLWCPAGLYSKFGQLFFVPLSEALQIILHLGETLGGAGPGSAGSGAPDSGNTQWEFPLDVLFTFIAVCFGLMTCTYGVGAATGLFVPSLAVGAGMGHVVGRVVQGLMGGAREDHLTVSLRSYAVLGAAASLGGATRMTLSITVLVMETTGSLQLIVPLMLVVFVSKTIGDMVNLGIYDTHIKIRGAPLLEEPGLDPHQKMLMDKLRVGELMAQEMVTLPLRPTVGEVLDVLKANGHQAFPVVGGLAGTGAGGGGGGGSSSGAAAAVPGTATRLRAGSLGAREGEIPLCGLIHRSTLLKLVEHRVWLEVGEDTAGEADRLPQSTFAQVRLAEQLEPRSDGPAKPLPELLAGLREGDEARRLDVGAFMQMHPYVIPEDATASRAYKLFRTMGLRHLLVGRAQPYVVGLVTRKDLCEDTAALYMGEKAARERNF